jgi:hypothetical protein
MSDGLTKVPLSVSWRTRDSSARASFQLRELLSLAVFVQTDVHHEAIPGGPVFQLDLADWFFHRLLLLHIGCGDKAADLGTASGLEAGSMPRI